MISDTIHAFLRQCKAAYAPVTHRSYTQALDLFVKSTDGLTQTTPTDDLTRQWAVDFLDFLQETFAVETEHLYMRAVVEFYRFAVEHGDVDIDIEALERYVEQNRRSKQHQMELPPVEAIQKIVHYARRTPIPAAEHERDKLRAYRDRAFILTLAATGLKVSEICALKRSDVNLDRSTLHLREADVELPTHVTHGIRTYLGVRQSLDTKQTAELDDLPLFARHDRRAGSNVLGISRWTGNNIVTYWVEQALTAKERQQVGSISPQTFRHYFVVKTLLETDDLETTRQRARHADLTTTRRYLQRLEEDEKDPSE